MAENYTGIETKQNSAEQVQRLAGIPSIFKLTAEELNQIVARINNLKFILDNLELNGGAGIQSLQILQYPFVLFSSVPSLAGYINSITSFEVSPGQIPQFKFFLFDVNMLLSVQVYSVRGVQEGIYGSGGTRILTDADLLLDYERQASAEEVEEANGTQLVNFGNISTPIQDWLNVQDPAIVLQPEQDGLVIFRGQMVGSPTSYLFIGPRATYGVGGQTALAEHFEPLEETAPDGTPPLAPQAGIPPASGTFVVPLTNVLGIDYTGTTTSLTNITIGSTVLGGNACIKGNWATPVTLPNDLVEADISLFVPNEINYLYIEKKAEHIIYWYARN